VVAGAEEDGRQFLILRSREAASRRMEAKNRVSWFETREGALLTMRNHAFGNFAFSA
jgi:hypothetical protein